MIKKSIKIGIAGYGTVGRGVVEILEERKDSLAGKVGVPLEVKKICDIKIKEPSGLFTNKIEDIFNDPEIEIFVELIGGFEPARRFILTALDKKMDVVTANKNVLSQDFENIVRTAKRQRRRVYFEAAVGGAIPIVAAVAEGLCANKITQMTGILNGTTNFILTEMSENGRKFKDALEEARKRGFAEADPSLDIEGHDTASKLAILSSIVFSGHIKPADIHTVGITSVRVEDVSWGRELGYEMKLLAVMESSSAGVFLEVVPAFILRKHPLASVRQQYNAIFVNGNFSGPLMFYGKGAGSYPAASAVVSDIVYVARRLLENTRTYIPFVDLHPKKVPVADISEMEARFYLRFMALDRPGVLAQIAGILANHNISIATVIQKETSLKKPVPIIILTHKTKMGNIFQAVVEADALKTVREKTVYYQIFDLE